MYPVRSSLPSVLALALALGACTPTKIRKEMFQSRVQSCYPYPALEDAGVRQPSFISDLERPQGCEPVAAVGTGGAPSSSGGAMTPVSSESSVMTSTSDMQQPNPVSAAGSSSTSPDTSGNPMTDIPSGMGSAGAGAVMPDATGGSGGTGNVTPPPPPALSPECASLKASRGFTAPQDDLSVVLLLFQSPAAIGGCQNPDPEGGCHEAGGSNGLDLVTPGVPARLRGHYRVAPAGEPYECGDTFQNTADRTWITVGGDETNSFLWKKVSSDAEGISSYPMPPCGDAMPSPPGDVNSLSQTDRECLRQWIRAVSKGAG